MQTSSSCGSSLRVMLRMDCGCNLESDLHMQLERLYFEGLRGDHSWLNSYGSRLAVRASVTGKASYMHTRIAFLPGYHGDNRN